MDTTINLTVSSEPVKTPTINLPKITSWYPPHEDREWNHWKYVSLGLALLILLMWWK